MGSFIPPINFSWVEEDLYRSGVPNELNYPFLEKLNLRKVLYLSPDELPPQFLNFLDDHDIELVPVGWDSDQTPWMPISEEVVLAALDVILDTENYPLHVMCNLGRHRTGTVIGCLRKLQQWNLTSVLEEYRRYVGGKVRLLNEQFIELFDVDLVRIPENPPAWL
ncbi:hypothetical protein, conserved [Cyanidioschyzon merolae strain 10D]|jgi:tyrosine-protein phosphatase OCA1|uniref:protein-tyrosine-phosphatase n=1 Tax=Cyanidioschyzon merolae (strain NIES-3377 / 10D) TaxID=280699 RepID=M1VJ97_CYAM1|nr:hypothetical protein, conserved [Cyanidioschyzon merolae strain 10D]BAM81328.1 hypothetical protein, conserved [Cyanidioschyzon merolae strain 10D]|eukprot:XP_005537364.1 hypothetical protein, conserved [Cyanidioschyzon merolae strain 10D]